MAFQCFARSRLAMFHCSTRSVISASGLASIYSASSATRSAASCALDQRCGYTAAGTLATALRPRPFSHLIGPSLTALRCSRKSSKTSACWLRLYRRLDRNMPLLGRSSLNALSSLPARPNSATKESVFNHDSAASEAARNLSSSGTMFGYPHQNRAAAAGKRVKVFPLCRPGLRPGSAAYPKFDSTLRRDLELAAILRLGRLE